MANPTQKHTKSRKRIRRGAISLKKITLSKCPKCKKPVRPHTVCSFCGTYRNREIIKIKLSKKEKKLLKKEQTQEKKDNKKNSKRQETKIKSN